MIKPAAICLTAPLCLCACLGTQDEATNSYFGTAKPNGGFRSNLNNAYTDTYKDSKGEGFTYQGGTDKNGFAAQASLLPGTDTAPWAPTGMGSYSGRYELIAVEDINLSGNRLSGSGQAYSGSLTLVANFGANTISGSSNNGALRINGEMSGNVMTGSVTFNGVDGDLRGLAGTDEAFGVFHGNNADLVFAGGFAATRN